MKAPDRPAPIHRRRALAVLLGSGALGGCVIAPSAAPPLQWVRLSALPADPSTSSALARPASEVWQLMSPLPLPGHLDRDALLVPQGATGLAPLGGVRWAEPLRDAVPRLLRDDLARLFGTPVWQAPLPAGLRPTRQLRIELLAFEVRPGGDAVIARARWSVAAPSAASGPATHGETHAQAPVSGTQPEPIVLAHRAALWALAQQIAAQVLATTR